MIYKLPKKGREEIEAMLGLSELKDTKVYQESKPEGVQETTEKIIPHLLHLGLTVDQTAAAIDMSANEVQQCIQNHPTEQ